MATIATTIQDILKHLGYTIASQSLEKYQAEVVPDLWLNELGRLRVWTANLEAHRTGQSSLDFRLREASHLKDQILRVLGRLQRTIQDLEALLHEHGPHEEYLSSSDDDSDDDKKDDQTEIQKIYHALHDTISILFDNAVAIRRPAHHDRLLGPSRLHSAQFEVWDRKHVADMFPDLDSDIANRLSLAISERRAILKYRELRHTNVTEELDPDEHVGLSETVATELVTKPAEDDDGSQSITSQTSHAKTITTLLRKGMVIPCPPEGSLSGTPFECPCCFLLIKVNNRQSWTHHVLRDLIPYVCVFPKCSIPHRLYESRREWYTHLQREHSVLNKAGSLVSCPLCRLYVESGDHFQSHVGRHLQELALFALPRSTPGEEYDVFKCQWRGCSDDRIYSSNPSLLAHIKRQHINSQTLKCSLCDHVTQRRNRLITHKIEFHADAVGEQQIEDAELTEFFRCEWNGCKRQKSSKILLAEHVWGEHVQVAPLIPESPQPQFINPQSFKCPTLEYFIDYLLRAKANPTEGLRNYGHDFPYHEGVTLPVS
ncbi:unnamed protein product [Penicillium bialowiezense]